MTDLNKTELVYWNRELTNIFGPLPISIQIQILQYRLVLLTARKKGAQK